MHITNWLAGWLTGHQSPHSRRRTPSSARLPVQSATVETLEARLLLKANPLGGEYTVNSYIAGQETLSAQSANAIAADHDGNYVVTWTSTGLSGDNHDGSFSGVYARLFLADGQGRRQLSRCCS